MCIRVGTVLRFCLTVLIFIFNIFKHNFRAFSVLILPVCTAYFLLFFGDNFVSISFVASCTFCVTFTTNVCRYRALSTVREQQKRNAGLRESLAVHIFIIQPPHTADLRALYLSSGRTIMPRPAQAVMRRVNRTVAL